MYILPWLLFLYPPVISFQRSSKSHVHVHSVTVNGVNEGGIPFTDVLYLRAAMLLRVFTLRREALNKHTK